MTELIRREWSGEVRVRAGADGVSERIIEGTIVPFGVVTEVQDSPGGPRYRETIAPGAISAAPDGILLDVLTDVGDGSHNTHAGATLVGRSVSVESDQGGARAAFRVARTARGDEALALAEDRVLRDLSVQFRPVRSVKRADGVIERQAIDVRRVALVGKGAYQGASVTAVRAATEGDMAGEESTGAQGATTSPATTGEAEAEDDAQAPTTGRPNRTRVTVEMDRDASRAAAERDTVAEISRGGGSRIRITREQMVYRADASWSGEDERGQRYSLLSDGWKASRGDPAAQERQARYLRFVEDFERQAERSAGSRDAWDRTIMRADRAGDVLSSEIPGAYPNDYVPGLFTPRILKGRPMGGFYQSFPISDGLPKIFPKTSTSTTVAVQSAEGANPAASDFATTAVTATPLLYGAETVVSRQVLDGSSPAAEAMLLGDMTEAYAQASETVIKTAVEAGSTASGVAITAATPYAGTLANVINYFGTRFKSANGAFIPSALFAVLAAQADTSGRPLLPMIGAQNSDGVTLADDAELALAVLTARTKLSYASTVNVCVFARPTDFVIFESPIARFSYDAVTGPSGVRVGIWAYLVVGARLGSLKVTAA